MQTRSLIRVIATLLSICIYVNTGAQTITVYHPNSAPQVGFSRTIAHNSSVAFPAYPANGSGPSSMSFAINNSSGANLVPGMLTITGGSNPADFVISSAPDLPSIPAGNNTITNASYFTITYTPTTNNVETAILTIPSNAVNIPAYVINLKGPGRQLYGAKNPPFGTSTITTTPVNPISCLSPYTGIASPCIGRVGGLTYNISAVQLAGRTTTYWGPEISKDGNLQMMLSMNGSVFGNNSNLTVPALTTSDKEVFTFDPAATASFGGLANGYAVFTGTSTRNTVNFGYVTSGIRLILKATEPDNVTPRSLVDPTAIGLSEQVGGLVQLTGSGDAFKVNMQVQAYQPNISAWRPYLDYYDDNSFYFNACGVCAFISTSNGFYWNNLAPRNTQNVPLVINEGATGTILSPGNMNVSDDEDLPAFPDRIVYNFNSNPVLNYGNGVMKKSGVVMTPATTFTLQDLQNNLITYEHDGSETTIDQFQFSARDSRGALMNDGNPANTNFSFGIQIVPVNDPPVTRDTAFTISYSPIPVTKNLVAYDPDLPGDPISFTIVTPPTKGTISGFNATTGEFTYTPNFGAPTVDNFTFQVFDGTVNSNISTVTINQVNLPPTSSNLSLVTQEDIAVSGTLTGTDPEGSAVSFNVVTSPAKGTLTSFNGTTGNFTYTPSVTKFGADYFTFRAQDVQGGLGEEDTVFVRIIPRLDPGDILVLDRYLVRLYDPATAQDTVITANQGLQGGGVNLAYRNGTSIFMFDKTIGLIKANPVSGSQSPVAPIGAFSTGPVGAPMGMLINSTGKIVVANPMPSSNILSVDSTTGAITVLFSGGNLGFPTGVVYLANGDLLVTDATVFLGGASKVIRITPAGVQTVVTSGNFLTLPLDLALIDQNTLVITDAGSFAGGTDRLIKINLTTGVQTVLSTGGNIAIPSGLDYRMGKLYAVNNSGTRRVLDIDPVSGVQIILPGSQLTEPWGLLIVPDPCTAGTWIGTANTDWFNAANWSCNTLPTATTDVTIPAGTPFQPVIGSPGTAQVRNLSILTGATLTNNSTLNINGGGAVTTAGTYKGSGNFTGAVYNNTGGIVSPGASPGCTVFGAGYTNGTGTEIIEIGGTTPCTQYDQLQVVGTATLSGTLDVQLFGGFIPSCGQSYIIMTANTVTGTFTTINYPAIPAGLSWNIQYNATSVVLSISGTPTATATPASQTVCSATPITTIVLSGSPIAGTTYTWTRDNPLVTGIAASGSGDISGTLTNLTNIPITVTFTITPTSGSCNGTPITATVTVNPTPDVNAVANQVVCNGAPTAPVTFTGTVAGTVFNWTNNTPSIGLAASGAGNIPSFMATNAGTTPVVATVTVTPTFGGAGGGPVTQTFNYTGAVQNFTVPAGVTSITVDASGAHGFGPANRGMGGRVQAVIPVTPGEVLQINVGGQGTDGVGGFNGGGAPGTNVGYGGGGGASDIRQGGTGLANRIVVAGGGGGTGSNCGFLSAPGGHGGGLTGQSGCVFRCFDCQYTGAGGSQAAGGIAGPTGHSLCGSNTNGSLGQGGSNTGGGFGTGGGGGYYGGGSGCFEGAGGGSSFTIPAATGVVHTQGFNSADGAITLSYNAGAGCAGTPITFTYTVNPTPTAVATPASQTTCSGTAITPIVITGNAVAGVVYNWTRDNTGTVTGIAASGAGNISGTLTNTTNVPVTVTFTITPTANGCAGTPVTATVLVNPTPTVNAVANQVLCNGAATTAVTFTGVVTAPPGTVYNWTNTQPSIGLAATGSGNIGSFTATNATAAPIVATIQVTPSYTNGGTTCNGTPISFTITVNPTPAVTITANPATGPYCGTGPVLTANSPQCTSGVTYSASFTNGVNTPANCTSWDVFRGQLTGSYNSLTITSSLGGTHTLNDPATAQNIANALLAGTPGTWSFGGNTYNVGVGCGPGSAVELYINQSFCSCSSAISIRPCINNLNWGGVNAATCSAPSQVLTVNFGSLGGGCNYLWNTGATTPSITPTTSGTYTVTVTTASGCVNTASYTVVITPIPDVNQPANQVVCNGAPTAPVTFTGTVPGTVFNWANSDPTIGLAASGTGDIAGFNAINTGTAPVVATITVTPSITSGGGGPVTQTFNYTGAIQTFIVPAGVTSLTIDAIGAQGGGSSFATAGGKGARMNGTYAVTPGQALSIVVGQQGLLQVGGNAQNSSGGGGGSFVYSAGPTLLVAAGGGGGKCNYTGSVPLHAGAAGQITTNGGASSDGNPGGTGGNGGNAGLWSGTPCAGGGAGWLSNGGGPYGGLGYNLWTGGPGFGGGGGGGTGGVGGYGGGGGGGNHYGGGGGGGGYSGGSGGTDPTHGGGGGSFSSGTSQSNTADFQLGNGLVSITYSAGGTCTGPSKTFTITVNPTPNATATPAAQTICSGAAITTIVNSGTVPGTVYNWTRDNPIVTGIANSGTGNISGTLSNPTNMPITVTFTVTPSYTNGGQTCTGTPVTATVLVNPTPDVNQPANQVVCNGAPTTAVIFTGSVTAPPGTVYTWTNNTPSIGLGAGPTVGNIPSFTAINTGTAPVVATITVTPSYTNGGVTCTGAPKTFTITVNPTATVNVPMNTTVCNGTLQPTGTYNFTTTATGGTVTYSWTNNNITIGLGGSGAGNSLPTFTATNTGTAPITGTITVTPTFTNGGVSCPGTPSSFTITVNPTPNATAAPASQTICSGDAITTIVITGTVPGTVFNWVRDNVATATGIAASGTGNISGSLTNTTNGPVLVTFTITPTYTSGGVTCTGPTATATVLVNPTATVNPVANQVVCNGAPTAPVVFTSPTTGGTITYAWTNDNTAIGLGASGTGNIPSFIGTNTTNGPIFGTITVTPTYTGGGISCVGTPTTFTITVNPTPQVDQPASQTVCTGAPTAPVVFTSPTTGGTLVFNWTNNNTTIGLAAAGAGNIPSFIGLNTTNAPNVGTIVVTPSYTNGGVTCVGPSKTFTITVNPIATVNQQPNQVICRGALTAPVVFTSPATGGTIVYNWTNDNISIGLAANGTGNIAAFVGTNITATPQTGTITVRATYTNNGVSCTGPAMVFTITVNPNPVVNQQPNQWVCTGAPTAPVNFTTPVTGGTVVYNWTNNNTSIGLAAAGTGNIPSFNGLNTTNAPNVGTITVIMTYTSGGISCAGPPMTFTITVNPIATVNQQPNQVVCNGGLTTTVAFSSPATGGAVVYNWNNNNTSIGLAANGTGDIPAFVATNTGTAPVVATITATATYTLGGVSCTGPVMSFTITVNPTPAVNPVANQVVCNGAPTTAITFTGPVPGTVYTWTNTGPFIGLGPNGVGNIPSFIASNPGVVPITATITVIPSYTNGGVSCAGAPVTFTITVNPTPTVDQPQNQVHCHGSPTVPVVFTGTVAGTVFTWTNNNTSIGLGASGTGNIPSFIATNTTNIVQVATIVVTPTYTNGGVSCTGPTKTFTITVNPIPTVNPVADIRVCGGAPVVVNFTGAVAGTVFNWVNDNPAIGLFASGTGNLNFVATNTSAIPIFGTITVTPTFTNGGVTCTGTPINFRITVNPTPTVNQQPNQVLCNGSATAPINFTGTASGAFYTWTNNQPSIGLGAAGAGDIPSFTALNAGTAPVVATVTVTPVFIAGGVTCTGPTMSFTITVNPTPAVNAVANQTVCTGTTTTAVTITGPVAGTVYTWTNNNTSIGLAASGTGTIPAFVAVNNTTSSVTATITMTPVYTNAGVSCSGPTSSFTITVNPNAVMNQPAGQVLCNGAATAPVTFSGLPPGSTYSWTNNNTSIGLAASGTGNIPSFTATNTTTTVQTATITITPTSTTCVGSPVSFTITVNPTPSVNQPANQVLCAGATTTAVAFSGPVAGTVYTWTNNNTSIGLGASGIGTVPAFVAINPTIGPITATITVTPTYTNAGVSCTGPSKSFTITVNALPNIIFDGVPPRVCLTDTIVVLKVGPGGGTWSGPGVSGNTFSATAAGLGVHVLSYTAANSNGCTATKYENVTVNDCIERHNVFATAIRIYPNPNSGRFNIRFNSDIYTEFNVRVIDAAGRVYRSQLVTGLRYGQVIPMYMPELASGMYFLQIYNDAERAEFPLVIVR